jgi:phosphate transport system substrate-binding protein
VRGWLTSSEASTVPHASSDGQTTYVSAVTPDGRLQRVAILALGTKYAFIGLLSNADVGLASRPILQNEFAEFLRDGEDMRSAACEKCLALDAVATVVSDNILVPAMSRQQVRDIFAGLIPNWSMIPGSGSSDSIRVVARKEGSGTLDAFREAFMELDGKTAGIAAYAKYVDGSEDISEHMRIPSSIGFVSFVYARSKTNPNAPRAVAISDVDIQPGGRLVPLRPVLPQQDTIGAEGYLGSRRVFAYVRARPRNVRAARLVEFSLSEHGQRIAAEHGFISQTVRVLSSSEAFAYPDTIPDERRLSMNIHFRSNSNELDSKAGADLERLVRYIGALNRSRITIVLRGHADSSGSAAINESLAMERCSAVHRALAAAGLHDGIGVTPASGNPATNHPYLNIASRGYSFQFPIASNQYELGKYRNRRVEVSLV